MARVKTVELRRPLKEVQRDSFARALLERRLTQGSDNERNKYVTVVDEYNPSLRHSWLTDPPQS